MSSPETVVKYNPLAQTVHQAISAATGLGSLDTETIQRHSDALLLKVEVHLAARTSLHQKAVDKLRATIGEMQAEIEAERDKVHRATLLCARGPVVFSARVREALGLPFEPNVDYVR